MFYEYAIAPEVAAKWGERHNYRYFLQAFANGGGRLFSRYPKKWFKLVWEEFQGEKEMDRKRLEELFVRLKEAPIKRSGNSWEESQGGWLENALAEHERFPFEAILATENPGSNPPVLSEDDLFRETCDRWNIPNGLRVERNAKEMLTAIAPMLALCKWVRFVDPFIGKCKNKMRHSMEAFFQALGEERPVGPPESIEVHTKEENAAAPDHVEGFFAPIIPANVSVTFYFWHENSPGPRLHNRYVLTDLGGVIFGHGLDTGNQGELDDVNRLDHDQHQRCIEEYCPDSTAFSLVEKLTVQGRKGQ
jgi:hypothetical protein